MKKLLVILSLVCFSIPAYSQYASEMYKDTHEYDGWLHKGYRGFVELGGGADVDERYGSFFINTTHGYQFSEWIFAGGGLGYLYSQYDDYDWPYDRCSANQMMLYADVRVTIPTRSRFYPYIDLKGGVTFFEWYGPAGYFNGELGVRYALNEDLGLSLGVYANAAGYYTQGAILGVALGFDF